MNNEVSRLREDYMRRKRIEYEARVAKLREEYERDVLKSAQYFYGEGFLDRLLRKILGR